MNWPISWQNVKNHIDDIEDGINPELLPKSGFGYSKAETIFPLTEMGVRT